MGKLAKKIAKHKQKYGKSFAEEEKRYPESTAVKADNVPQEPATTEEEEHPRIIFPAYDENGNRVNPEVDLGDDDAQEDTEPEDVAEEQEPSAEQPSEDGGIKVVHPQEEQS